MMSSYKQITGVAAHNTFGTGSGFQIPSKERKAIPIVMPMADAPQKVGLRPNPQVAKSLRPVSPPLVPVAQSSSAWPESQRDPTLYKHVDLTKWQTPNPVLAEPQHQVIHCENSTLDIYSRNYVPLWLRAVNDSIANFQPSPCFRTVDFGTYIGTFAGYDFVRPVSPVAIPPPVQTQVPGNELSPSNYIPFWLQRLQNEFAHQTLQLKSFALYNSRLHPVHGRAGYFVLNVPGLRENAPRLDLGDTVHIRVLNPVSRNLEAQVMHWLEYGQHQGTICPGFTGLLFDPQVWEIDRAHEMVTLCIDGLFTTVKCNVIFLLQETKLEPICRAVQTTSKGTTWLRHMLFPGIDTGVLQTTLSKANFDIGWVDDLNWEQKKAVHNVLTANYGNMPYLISGPPGTGKTKTLVEIALQLLEKAGHILICAPSDAAADTLALRLSVHLQPTDLFRLNGITRTFAEVPDRLLQYTYSNSLSFALPPIEQMLSFRIVVTTCRDADMLNRARLTNRSLSSLFNGVKRLLLPESSRHPLHWTALLLDEAAQATEPDTLIPFTVVMPPDGDQCPQFVAAGDQYQLGPKILSKSELVVSLFQRLFDMAPYCNHPLSRKNGMKALKSDMLPMMRPAFTNLIRNYRSHPAILSVPSALFYNDTLITERKTSEAILSWSGWPSTERWPVLFRQNYSADACESIVNGDGTGTGALYNPGEAEVALECALSLLQHVNKESVLDQKDIMIMSPFRAQVSYLRKVFRRSKLYEVNIGPLEAFQGLESRVVIICTTRTRVGTSTQSVSHHVMVDKHRGLGVIDEPQRLNVAMTRAQEGLIVIGDVHCLISTRDNQWLHFLDFCKRNKCFVAPTGFRWPNLGGPYQQGRLERALIYAALGKADAENNRTAVTDQEVVYKQSSRLQLRGPQKDMDEEMWQFKELARNHDNENVDLLLEHDVLEGVTNGHLDRDNEGEEKSIVDGYDRNLKQEFHQECTAQ